MGGIFIRRETSKRMRLLARRNAAPPFTVLPYMLTLLNNDPIEPMRPYCSGSVRRGHGAHRETT